MLTSLRCIYQKAKCVSHESEAQIFFSTKCRNPSPHASVTKNTHRRDAGVARRYEVQSSLSVAIEALVYVLHKLAPYVF